MVSVIIPSYNHHKYLKQRIDSVINQTFQDFEIIILDDNSPDRSREVIELYKEHPKVSNIVFNIENSGSVFKQWRKGIQLAKGKYIWIAESDDFADPSFLEVMIKLLEDNDKLSFAYCNSYMVDENNISLNRTLSDHRNESVKGTTWNHTFEANGLVFLRNYLSKNCWVNNASAVLFRGEKLRHLSFSLSEYKFAGDWAVYMDLLFKGDVMYYHKCLSYYREHSLNASKKAHLNNEISIEIFTLLSRYYNYLKSNGSGTIKYVFNVRMHIVPILITSPRRSTIYKKMKGINRNLLIDAIRMIPLSMLNIIMDKIKHEVKKRASKNTKL